MTITSTVFRFGAISATASVAVAAVSAMALSVCATGCAEEVTSGHASNSTDHDHDHDNPRDRDDKKPGEAEHAGHNHAAGAHGNKNAEKESHAGHSHAAGEHVEAAAADWCDEHKLPESKCSKCNPDLIVGFKARGDWCAEHGFPESACPSCNPQSPPAGLGHQTVTLNEAGRRAAGIVVAAAQKGPLAVRLSIPAEVRFNPDRLAHVTTMAPGQLVEVMVTIGDHVKRGQVVARLRSVAVGRARAEWNKARAHLRAAEKARTRQRRLRKSGINSERDLISAELELARAQADKQAAAAELSVFGVTNAKGAVVEIRSPLDGVIIDRHATRGEFVDMTENLFVIADMREIWVVGQAYDRHLAAMSVGMTARVKLDAFNDRVWQSKVSYISASVDEKSRTAGVRVVLDNKEGLLRPGLFGSLELEPSDASDRGVVVPSDAVQRHDDRSIVFREQPGGDGFVAVPVSVLRRTRGLVEVAGLDKNVLKVGDRIVSSGAFILKSDLVKGSLADSCGGH